MNIIEVWKEAKAGQVVTTGNCLHEFTVSKSSSGFSLLIKEICARFGLSGNVDNWLLSDNWHIKKEKRHKEMTFKEVMGISSEEYSKIPQDAKVSIDWEE